LRKKKDPTSIFAVLETLMVRNFPIESNDYMILKKVFQEKVFGLSDRFCH